MTITPDDLVRREVCHTCSYLVSTLAANYGLVSNSAELGELVEQAYELAAPIDDWAETAIQNGWRVDPTDPNYFIHPDHPDARFDDPQRACEEISGIDDPCQFEVYEHWIITDWLADKLEAHGEKVDRDFAGLTVWARTTTGQAIAADSVIEAITAEVNAGV
jgi:hypothetical protein